MIHVQETLYSLLLYSCFPLILAVVTIIHGFGRDYDCYWKKNVITNITQLQTL